MGKNTGTKKKTEETSENATSKESDGTLKEPGNKNKTGRSAPRTTQNREAKTDETGTSSASKPLPAAGRRRSSKTKAILKTGTETNIGNKKRSDTKNDSPPEELSNAAENDTGTIYNTDTANSSAPETDKNGKTGIKNNTNKHRPRHGRRRALRTRTQTEEVNDRSEWHFNMNGSEDIPISFDDIFVPKEDAVKDTGIDLATIFPEISELKIGTDNDTDINNTTETVIVPPPLSEPPTKPEPVQIAGIKREPAKGPKAPVVAKSRAHPYDPSEFAVVQMMNSLSGFAPLGLLFILMEILNGTEEGLIRVNRLAVALGIGKPALLAQLENLEKANLIRTVSSSQRGRHIELLVPNLLPHRAAEASGTASSVPPPVLPSGPVCPGFSVGTLRALYAWLADRGIQITSVPDESALDPRFLEIAAFLGKYLTYVEAFYTRLKATLTGGEEIRFSLLGFRDRDITHILNFCKMLQETEMLSSFTYRRAPHCKIIARLNRTPAAINFLSGGWLEHYIRDRVVAILTAHPATHDMPFAFLKNPRILLPGDENFEFDFLLMVAGHIFWIEAKTGEYLEFLPKYSRVSKLLGLNRNSAILVLVDAPPPDATLSARYGINCCGVDEFPELFRISMVRELSRT